MKGGTRIAIGVGVGYLLGRTRKMRFALSLAGAAMARRSTGTPADLLERGTALLKSSSALTELTDTVRGELMDAARSAAVTAASNRIDALNERLQQGATLVSDTDRHRERDAGSDEHETGDEPRRDAEITSGRGDAPDEDEYGTDRDDQERAGARRATRARSGGPVNARTRRAASSRTSNRGAGSEDRTPVSSSARRRASADAGDAPVRRTRR